MIKTSKLLAAFAALLFALCAQAGPYPDVTVPFELQRVPNSNVYYVIGQSGVADRKNQGFMSNAGFVVTSKGVVVYDSLASPSLGYRLLQAIRSVTDKPVAIVVAGHYHADHIYGLQAFKEHTQAQIWAQERAYEYINDPYAERRLAQRRKALHPWVDAKTRVIKPDHTYRDRHVFDMGDTHIELVHAGPAHSPEDTIMIVREPGVVFSGDLIFSGRLPFVGSEQVDTRNWIEQLTRLQHLDPPARFIVPGHGHAAADAQAAIRFTQDYLLYLRKHMGAAANDLVPFDEAYQATDWSHYRDLPAFDAANRINAYQVYLEVQGEGMK